LATGRFYLTHAASSNREPVSLAQTSLIHAARLRPVNAYRITLNTVSALRGASDSMANRWEIEGQRWEVLLPARMRSEGPPSQVTILDVSTSGVKISTRATLRPGSYVEIVRGSTSIVGRVVWVKDAQAGIMSRDRIDIQKLLALKAVNRLQEIAGDPRMGRRAADPRTSIRQTEERSAQLGRLLQFVVLGSSITIFAITVASIAYDVLHAAMIQVEHALGR
jgi:hypothetical protein